MEKVSWRTGLSSRRSRRRLRKSPDTTAKTVKAGGGGSSDFARPLAKRRCTLLLPQQCKECGALTSDTRAVDLVMPNRAEECGSQPRPFQKGTIGHPKRPACRPRCGPSRLRCQCNSGNLKGKGRVSQKPMARPSKGKKHTHATHSGKHTLFSSEPRLKCCGVEEA